MSVSTFMDDLCLNEVNMSRLLSDGLFIQMLEKYKPTCYQYTRKCFNPFLFEFLQLNHWQYFMWIKGFATIIIIKKVNQTGKSDTAESFNWATCYTSISYSTWNQVCYPGVSFKHIKTPAAMLRINQVNPRPVEETAYSWGGQTLYALKKRFSISKVT